MKKIVCLFALVLSVVSVSAQFKDLVTLQDTDVYMFNPVPDSLEASEAFGHLASTLPLGSLVSMYVPHGQTIVYGIALTLSGWEGRDSIYQNPNYHAVLMQRSQYVSDSVEFSVTHRTLRYLDSLAMDTTLCSINFTKFRYEFSRPKFSYGIVPCYELYFEEPRVMTDTFYVGRKYMAIPLISPREYGGIKRFPNMFPCFWYSPFGDLVFNDYIGQVYWGFAFPIIGFHCKPLDEESHSLLLTDINDNGATVHWYSVEDGATYNVRLTSADGSIDSTVVTSDSSYAFYGLPTNHRYQVRVRKQCYYATSSYDTTVYSPWTMANTNFTLGVDTTGTGGNGGGIDTTGTGGNGGGTDTTGTGGNGGGDTTHTAIVMVDGANFSVSPNPVHGTLVVSFMQTLSEDGVLTLYDLGGREVRRTTVTAGSTKVDFDAEGCPAGAYLLKLITARGITTRRLLVE